MIAAIAVDVPCFVPCESCCSCERCGNVIECDACGFDLPFFNVAGELLCEECASCEKCGTIVRSCVRCHAVECGVCAFAPGLEYVMNDEGTVELLCVTCADTNPIARAFTVGLGAVCS